MGMHMHMHMHTQPPTGCVGLRTGRPHFHRRQPTAGQGVVTCVIVLSRLVSPTSDTQRGSCGASPLKHIEGNYCILHTELYSPSKQLIDEGERLTRTEGQLGARRRLDRSLRRPPLVLSLIHI